MTSSSLLEAALATRCEDNIDGIAEYDADFNIFYKHLRTTCRGHRNAQTAASGMCISSFLSTVYVMLLIAASYRRCRRNLRAKLEIPVRHSGGPLGLTLTLTLTLTPGIGGRYASWTPRSTHYLLSTPIRKRSMGLYRLVAGY